MLLNLIIEEKNGWAAFKQYRKLWSSTSPMEFKVHVFIAAVQSVLISAISCLVLSERDYCILESCHQKMLRVLLLGRACSKVCVDGEKKYSAISYHEICSILRLPPLRVTIRCQRLKFLQAMVADTTYHNMFWSVMLGKYTFEDSVKSNPWTEQYCQDLIALEDCDDAYFLAQRVARAYPHVKGRALKVFLIDDQCAADFVPLTSFN